MLSSSSLPVTLIVLLLSTSRCQKFKGDSCLINNAPGTCKMPHECPPVLEELLKGNRPSVVCDDVGFDPMVCCPSDKQSTATTTSTTTSTERPGPGGSPLVVSRAGNVARSKCEEYARSVTQLIHPPILIADVKPMNRTVCAITSRKLIVGGKKAGPKEFPHMAAIGFNTESGIEWSCGGSLISEKFVLTAAHCIYSRDWGKAAWVRVGDLNLKSNSDDAQPQEIKIVQRFRHPEYTRNYHDIGLLQLEKEAIFDAYVRPGCLPYSLPETTENVATAAGWGYIHWNDEPEDKPDDLLKVTINLIPQATCDQSFKKDTFPRGIIDEWQLCAGEPGKDTCQGDSGGPLMVLNQDYFCMYNVIGITSFGGTCGSITPGVYTRVYNYLLWIERTVWPELF